MKGILLNTDFDLRVNNRRNNADGLIVSGLTVANNTDQCAVIVLAMQQGELKEDPLLGAGLTRFMRGKYSESTIEERIRQHLTRAGINYYDYRQRISIEINSNMP